MYGKLRSTNPWTSRAVAAALLGAALSAPAVSPAAAATGSANLLLNSGAETSQCSPGGWEETTLPGWQITSGDPVINCYNATNGANTTTPGSPSKGTAYFQGGSRGSSEMTQTTDVSSAATAIDAGGVHSTVSGWLGGVSSYNDAAAVRISYLSASGASLGTSSIGPVLAADRSNTTEFLQRSATATVPVGTRSILTAVDFTMTGTQNDGLADDLSLTLDTATAAPALTVPASTVPGYDHVFVVMMENNNLSASSNTVDGGAGIIGNSAAPYINNTLVPMGSLLTNYHAGTHNSDPNYEQIAFGNSYGRSNKAAGGGNANCITSTACTATNNGLSDNLDAAGKSWKQYVQSQTSNCQTTDSGNYSADDVPFYYAAKMKNDNAYCQAHWQPLPQLLNTDLASTASTPAFTWFDADGCSDMEGCGIASGDTWLSQTLPTLFNSPAWTQQKSLLILTTDEDGSNAPGGWGPGQTNQVMTLAIGSQGTVKAGYQDANRYDHYSTARVIEGALGLTTTMTDNDKWATPYNEVFTTAGTGTGGNTVAVTGPGSQNSTLGTAISPLQIQASDSASGQTLTYAATGLPAGLAINSSGLITGTPTAAGSSTVTLTVTDGTGAAGTTTFGWTVGAASGCTSAQLLGNPGFETGTAAPWTATAGVVNNDTTSEPAHSGSYDAWLDGYGAAHTDTLSQAVTIPTGCKGTFSFWLHVDTAKTGTTAADTLKVTANGTTLAGYSNLNANTGYVQESFDVSSFAGRTVTLTFTGTEDSSSAQTSFVIDDSAVNVS
ncbi:alkaline phosphatase family protein [Kitasatospora sp. MAP5-34]|uniref:alkaline phosphatase family protein n=1 Tax=Kitasatospora sp. MAP5-34 TaxID=3035102 RepID=UPI002475F11A|nr:alkaline phosphatase family protein [Kitasatospora sp. MAP5-34]MDH6579073.1 hypothetical protein [Kitasatospora sp. MAP5-34]